MFKPAALVGEIFDLLVTSTNAECNEESVSEDELPENCETEDNAGEEDEGYFAHFGGTEEELI